MAGVKGRSGRQKATFQEQRQKVIDKAWEICFQILNDPTAPMSQKADIAKALVVKNMPTQMEGIGDTKIIIVRDQQPKPTETVQQEVSTGGRTISINT